jgi:5'(3')-deoxyribonucleotidase
MEEKKFSFLLDMDGVLCDFVSGALKVLNQRYDKEYTIEDYATNFGRWQTYDYYGITEKEFWNTIYAVPNFWINLKSFSWTKQLYNELLKLGGVTVVTTPSRDPECAAQKLEWLNDCLGIEAPDVFVGGKKHLMAGNGILIDDNRTNVDTFIAAGGEAILVPSTWNCSNLTFEGVWSYIQNYLDTRNARIHPERYIIGTDPINSNKIQFNSGMVRDTNKDKPRFDLISPLGLPYEKQMLTRWARLMAYGANHYSARNWEKASGQEELDRFKESAHRHFMQWFFSDTSGEDHAAAVFFNISGAEMVKDRMNHFDRDIKENETVEHRDAENTYRRHFGIEEIPPDENENKDDLSKLDGE